MNTHIYKNGTTAVKSILQFLFYYVLPENTAWPSSILVNTDPHHGFYAIIDLRSPLQKDISFEQPTFSIHFISTYFDKLQG